MTIDVKELIRILPKLIRENDEVKGAIITALSGVVATRDDIRDLIREMDKRFEAVDKRFEAVDKRFEAVDKHFELVHQEIEGVQDSMQALKVVVEGNITETRDGIKRIEDILCELRDRVL